MPVLKGSDNPFPSVLFDESTTPATPDTGQQRLFVDDADGLLKLVDDAGTVTAIGAGFANPMTTSGDIIYGASSGTPTRLAKSTDGKVLTLASGLPSWATPSAGFSDPMTTRGDVIVRNASNVTARLAVGSSGKVLSSDGTDISWQTPSAGGLTSAYLGYNTVGGTEETATINRVTAKLITPAATCLLQSIQIYTRETADSTQALLVSLYEDNAGVLGKLLAHVYSGSNAMTNNASFSASTSSIARWLAVPLSYVLTGSTSYWVGWMWQTGGSPQPRQFYDGSGTDRRYDSGGQFLVDGGRYTESTDSRKYSVRALTIS